MNPQQDYIPRREKLLEILHKHLRKKNTVIVIEHNIDVIKNSDWVIDLGPEGGDKGGFILFEGTVNELIKQNNNETAKCLKLSNNSI